MILWKFQNIVPRPTISVSVFFVYFDSYSYENEIFVVWKVKNYNNNGFCDQALTCRRPVRWVGTIWWRWLRQRWRTVTTVRVAVTTVMASRDIIITTITMATTITITITATETVTVIITIITTPRQEWRWRRSWTHKARAASVVEEVEVAGTGCRDKRPTSGNVDECWGQTWRRLGQRIGPRRSKCKTLTRRTRAKTNARADPPAYPSLFPPVEKRRPFSRRVRSNDFLRILERPRESHAARYPYNIL